MATKEAIVGDHTYRIGRFSALKGEVAGLVVSKVTTEAREVMRRVEEAEREWNERNKVRITRDECAEKASNFRAAADTVHRMIDEAPDEAPEVKDGEPRRKTRDELQSEERMFRSRADAWDEQGKEMGERPYIELPHPDGVPDHELVLAGFEKAFQIAPQAVKRLIAVVVMSDGDLIEAYKAGAVEEKLDEVGLTVFAEGDIEEVLSLAVTTAEVLELELPRYRGPFGQLRAMYKRFRGQKQETPAQTATETEDAAGPETEGSAEPDSASTTSSPSESPTASTPSHAPTTGVPETSSEPVGASSSPSAPE